MSCSNIQNTFTIVPFTTGYSYTVFTLQGSVSSNDPAWIAANKVISYETYSSTPFSSIHKVATLTSTDFFGNTAVAYYTPTLVANNPTLNILSAVVTVSSDYLNCSPVYTISSLNIILTPTLTSTLSSDALTTLDYLKPSGNFIINLSSLDNANNVPFVARVQLPNYSITSFYIPDSLYFSVSDFGVFSCIITAIPLISSEDLSTDGYLAQAEALGFKPNDNDIDYFEIVNRAYAVTTNITVRPTYAPDIETIIGYAPSIYLGNTGTSFNISAESLFTNYSSTSAITSVNVSYIGDITGTNITIFDTLTTFRGAYTPSSNSVSPGINLPISIDAGISGIEYAPTYTSESVVITLVDPPIIKCDIQSSQILKQDDLFIVSNNITFNINTTATLPYAYIFNNGYDSSQSIAYSNTSFNISIFEEGTPYTATITAYPLLSATTDVNYITSDARIQDTGILPIAISKNYIVNKKDAVIPQNNIHLNYTTSSIKYNNENTSTYSYNNVAAVSALRYFNQYEQFILPELSLQALIGSSTQYSLEALKPRLNDKNIYISIAFNNITSTNIFNLLTLLTATNIETMAPAQGEIVITVRPKDTFNITTKTVPYSGIAFNFVTPSMYFSKFTPSWYASIINPYPFEVAIWNDTEQTIDTIQTYVDGSKSYPYNPDLTRYARLVPQWWFQDINGNKSETYNVENVKLYNSYDGSYIGTSGIATFLFHDDSPTGVNGELLVVTPIVSGVIVKSDMLDNVTEQPGYANPLQKATQLYYVNNLHPTKLDITRDGARELKKYYWYTNPIPNTITLNNIQQLNEKHGIDFSYPYNNNTHPYYVGLSGTSFTETVLSPETTANRFTVTYYNTSFNAVNEQQIISTGFVRDTLSPNLSTGYYKLIASVTVHPSGQYAHTPFVWVCDNKNNLITKLFYENGITDSPYTDCIQNLIQQQYLKVPVSGINSMLYRNSSLDVMSLTGISEATNIAIDGLYNVWVTDGGNDIVYKISNTGTLQKTISAPIGSTPGSLCIDSKQNVWFTLVDDVSALKYSTDGELLATIVSPVTSDLYIDNPYKPGGIDIDIDDNVWVTFYNSVCSIISKYTSNGDYITSVALPPYYSPTDIIVDGENLDTAWVLTEHSSNNSEYTVGAIHKITGNTSEVLLSGFNTPTHFNIDANRNLWMILGSTFVLKYNIDTTAYKMYDLSDLLNQDVNNVPPLDITTYIKESGIDWEKSIASANLRFIYSFAYGNGKFVGVGDNRFNTTTNNLNWGAYKTTIPTGLWGSIAFGNNKFVAVSNNYYGGIYSTDGEAWQNNNLPSSSVWHKVRYINNKFVAVGAGPYTLATSNDGVNWIATDAPGTGMDIFDITYGDGLYVAVGLNGTWVSTDLNTWTYTNLYTTIGSASTTLVFGNDRFLFTSVSNVIYISPDGVSWTPTTQPAGTFTSKQSLAYGNGKFVVASYGSPGKTYFLVSRDGYEWFKSNELITNVTVEQILFANNAFYTIPRAVVTIGHSTASEDIITNKLYEDNINQQTTYTDINGIGGHSDGTIYIISSKRNKVYILQSVNDNIRLKQTFNIYPINNLNSSYNDNLNIAKWSGYSTIVNPYFYNVQNVDWEIGVQAHGDWTGLRRILKYCPTNTTTSYTISGESEQFEIKASPPEIRVLNDSYNLSNALSLIFPGFLNAENYPTLHEEFLPGSLGTDASTYQTIGRQYYEKIANFVRNHSDIDFCNVDQLYSIASMLGISIDNFNLNYPADIIKALNVLSIQHKRLFGDIDNFNRRFVSRTFARADDNMMTVRAKLNYDMSMLPASTILSAGYPLVVHDLIINKFDLLYINTTTELKYLSGYGLRYPVYNFDADVFNQYKFYNYKPNELPSMVNSFIDWNSTYTTVVSSASSIEEWYGDQGVVEQIFNYYLNKGLGFVKT